MHEALQSLIVAVCLITTIFLVARVDRFDGLELWATLIAAGMTNTVVTAFIVGGRESRSAPGKHRKGMHS